MLGRQLNHDFRRSNCLRQAFPSNLSMQLPPRANKKSIYIDYSTLRRIFGRKNFTSMKRGFSLQQCASVLLPIIFSTFLIIVCAITALALLTDGFSLWHCRDNSSNEEYDRNSSSLCLTNDCIRKAYFLINRLDKSVPICENFYRFTCGRVTKDGLDASTKFKLNLRSKLEQNPRPSFPVPYRLLFDFYDSCTSDEHQEQLGTQPFNTLISRLGGWALLQNAKFDDQNFEWEPLEVHLSNYGIDGLLHLESNPNRNRLQIGHPKFMLSDHRRQALDEYFTRLLAELDVDVDEELSQLAVQETLDFESKLLDAYPTKSNSTIKLDRLELKKRFPKVKWDKLLMGTDQDNETEIFVESDYLTRLESQIANESVKKTIANYMMMHLLHTVSPYFPRRYRIVRDRLDNRYEPRSEVCFNEMMRLMPIPLYGFSFYQQLETLNVKKTAKLISKSKEQIGKQLRSIGWIDPKTKEKMLKNLHNLRVITDVLSGDLIETQIRTLYSTERLDPTSYFDNVLMLRQTNSRMAYKTILSDYDWEKLLLSESPEIDTIRNELVYGPVSLNALLQLPEAVQGIQIRRNILEYLFHSDAITKWKPEPRSIFHAKSNCFEKDALMYDQMALKASENDEKLREFDDLKLPGLGDYSAEQLMYIAFVATRCDQVSATTPETEKSMNQILQNSDHFADVFHCRIGEPMNPRDKCSVM